MGATFRANFVFNYADALRNTRQFAQQLRAEFQAAAQGAATPQRQQAALASAAGERLAGVSRARSRGDISGEEEQRLRELINRELNEELRNLRARGQAVREPTPKQISRAEQAALNRAKREEEQATRDAARAATEDARASRRSAAAKDRATQAQNAGAAARLRSGAVYAAVAGGGQGAGQDVPFGFPDPETVQAMEAFTSNLREMSAAMDLISRSAIATRDFRVQGRLAGETAFAGQQAEAEAAGTMTPAQQAGLLARQIDRRRTLEQTERERLRAADTDLVEATARLTNLRMRRRSEEAAAAVRLRTDEDRLATATAQAARQQARLEDREAGLGLSPLPGATNEARLAAVRAAEANRNNAIRAQAVDLEMDTARQDAQAARRRASLRDREAALGIRPSPTATAEERLAQVRAAETNRNNRVRARAAELEDQTARLNALATRQRNQLLDREARLGITPRAGATDVDRWGEVRAREAAQANLIKAAAANRAADADIEGARASALNSQARRRLTRAENVLEREIMQAAGEFDQGTRFQRLQARINARQFGQPRSPLDFQTGRQMLLSSALTTGKFALTGGLLYGAISQVSEIMREAEQLNAVLRITESQFEAADQAAEFPRFRQSIHDIARETGVMANEVAEVSRRLLGVFRTVDEQTGEDLGPDLERVRRETQAAMELSQISGLPTAEINDSLVATQIAFRTTFRDIGDTAVDLENRLGAHATEIIRFTADIAPLASELQFTQREISVLGAISQRASGQGGAALAERFGRILTVLRDNRIELVQFYTQLGRTDIADQFSEAFARGDMSAVIRGLVDSWGELGDAQRQQIIAMVGGRREGQALVTILNDWQTVQRELSSEIDATGAQQQRFAQHQRSVGYAFAQLERAVEEFGDALFRAGGADALRLLAGVGSVFADLLTGIGAVNEAMGGFPAKAAAIAVAINLVRRAWVALQATRFVSGIRAGATGQNIAGFAAGAAQQFTMTGGFLSPYRQPAMPPGVYGPAVPQVRPMTRMLGLSGLAARGGAGAAFAGLVGSLGPTLAITGGLLALQQYMSAREEASQEAQEFADRLAQMDDQELAETVDELRRQGDLDPSGWTQIRTHVTGGRLPEELLRDREQRANAPRRVAQGRAALQRADIEELLRTIEDPLAQLVEDLEPGAYSSGGYGRRELRAAQRALEASRQGPEAVDRLIAQYKDDPANDELQQAVAFLLQNLGVVLGAEEMNSLVAAFDQAQQDAQTAVDAATRQQDARASAETARMRFEAGQIDFDTYIAALQSNLETAKGLLADAEAAGTTDEQAIQQITSLEQEIRNAFTEALDRRLQTNQAIAEIMGTETDEGSLDEILREFEAYQALPPGQRDPQTTLDLLGRAAERRKAIRQRQIDRARSAAEIDALIDQPFQMTDVERDTLLNLQIDNAQNRAAIRAEAQRSGRTVSDVRMETLNNLREFGRGQVEINRAIVGAQIDRIDQQIADYATRGPQARGIVQELRAERQRLTGLLASGMTGADVDVAIEAGLSEEEREELRIRRREMALAEERSGYVLERSRIRGDRLASIRNQIAEQRRVIEYQRQFGTIEEQNRAEAELNDLEQQEADAERARADAQFNLRQSRIDDPVRRAENTLARARQIRRGAVGPDEIQAADQAVEDAQNELDRAIAERQQAQESLWLTSLEGNPLAQANAALAFANRRLADAKRLQQGEAAIAAAQQAVVAATRQRDQVLNQIAQAQDSLFIAIAESIGDVVAVASRQAEAAERAVRELRDRGFSEDNPELVNARAEAIRARANAVSVARNDRIGDLEWMYETDRITADAFIAGLEAELAQIPETNKEARREIERRIRALREEMGRDMQMNLGDLRLPVTYEARRMGLSQQMGVGYQDNRVYEVSFVNQNAQDYEASIEAFTNLLEAPPTTGTTTRILP